MTWFVGLSWNVTLLNDIADLPDPMKTTVTLGVTGTVVTSLIRSAKAAYYGSKISDSSILWRQLLCRILTRESWAVLFRLIFSFDYVLFGCVLITFLARHAATWLSLCCYPCSCIAARFFPLAWTPHQNEFYQSFFKFYRSYSMCASDIYANTIQRLDSVSDRMDSIFGCNLLDFLKIDSSYFLHGLQDHLSNPTSKIYWYHVLYFRPIKWAVWMNRFSEGGYLSGTQ